METMNVLLTLDDTLPPCAAEPDPTGAMRRHPESAMIRP